MTAPTRPSFPGPLSPRALIGAISAGRVVAGLAFICAPRGLTRLWLGTTSDDAGSAALGRVFGVRDAALGLGTLLALGSRESPSGAGEAVVDVDEPLRIWVRIGALCDAGDAVTTALVAVRAPGLRRTGILALSAASAATLSAVSRT